MSNLFPIILALAATASAAAILPRGYSNSTTNTTVGHAYSLVAEYSGTNFFDHFTAFSGSDPTEGHVQYQTLEAAAEQGLIGYVFNSTSNTNNAYIGVDSQNVAPDGRNAVRLTSKDTFNAGSMAVIDVIHAPSQYGAWPAIWLLGSQGTWPASGESDILEFVHQTNYNAMTLHTSPDCVVDNVTTSAQQGQLLNSNCNAGNAGTGCSVAAYDQNTMIFGGGSGSGAAAPNKNQKKSTTAQTFSTAGSAFNSQTGGVYVHDWQPDGITVWMFPREHLPADLVAGSPNPSSWTQTPLARFTGAGCKFDRALQEMQLIINITFCGTWAGKVWESSGAKKATGVETCEQYVANHPERFADTHWELGSVKFFSSTGEKPGVGPLFS